MFSRNLKKLAQPRGMSLGEVVISILILSSGIIAAVSLMVYTMRLAKVSEHYALANNLARSGLELLRSKRDSNWLFESGNIRDNWNLGFQPLTGEITFYARADLAALDAETYFGYSAEITRASETEAGPDPDPSDPDDPYRLYRWEIKDENNHSLVPPVELYGHLETPDPDKQTPYYRWLTITYPIDTANPTASTNCCYINGSGACTNKFFCLKADSTVAWLENGEPRSTTTSTKLYDWYNQQQEE